MRVLIFHGYLLRGTGSNVYNASLAAALIELGHEVDLLCQDPEPEALPFVGSVGNWEGGRLVVRRVGSSACAVFRPAIGRVLPVYVADRYEGFDAIVFPDLTGHQLEDYLQANVRAVGDVIARHRPDVALANHLVMGPVILARALAAAGIPYAVTIHGSALEYTVKPHPRFLPYAKEGLASAAGVLVGSRHTAESLWAALEDPSLAQRTRLGPPGVDIETFSRRPTQAAARRLLDCSGELEREAQAVVTRTEGVRPRRGGEAGFTGSAFDRDVGEAADALRSIAGWAEEPLVVFVGKLILSKGIDLLLAAWPLVLAKVPRARLAVVGFGSFRPGAEKLVAALTAGDLGAVGELARNGREAEGGPRERLRLLASFLQWLERAGQRERYLECARKLGERTVFTGRLEHTELADLLPLCQAIVAPSTFPEAFGMVVAEAAACGALPIAAAHSGLVEVTRTLGQQVPSRVQTLMSFPLDDEVVIGIAERVASWLLEPRTAREPVRRLVAQAAEENYSWQGVARGVIAAARGELEQLPRLASE